MYPPDTIANWLLCFGAEHGDVLSHLKLQKMVYYAQAWRLALQGEALFEEDFEAWVHGPVLRSLYEKYRGYGWQPVPPPANYPDVETSVSEHLEEVFAEYGRFSAFDLERMTHQEQPWVEARGDLSADEPSNAVISKDTMATYYAAQAE